MTMGVFSFVVCLVRGHKQLIISDYPNYFRLVADGLAQTVTAPSASTKQHTRELVSSIRLRVSDIRGPPLSVGVAEKPRTGSCSVYQQRQKKPKLTQCVDVWGRGRGHTATQRQADKGRERERTRSPGDLTTHRPEYQVTARGLRALTEMIEPAPHWLEHTAAIQ